MDLSKVLSKYQNIQATKKDVLDLLEQYRALNYRLDSYVFNDGSKKDLLSLTGTIPVVYKQNTYHIPICIWLMDTHPYNAPICYVKPTTDMHIKVSMYVDHNGKIYLPYLHDWQPNSSDLLGLIQVMIVTFGEHPPVYSKPKQAPYPGQSFMPQPGAGNASYNPSFPQSSNFPPYPTNNYGGGYPPYPPNPNSSNTPYPQSNFMPGMPSGFNSAPANNAGATGTISEEHIKASLISAVEDKMRRRIYEKVNQCQAEIQTLKRTKQELMEGQTKLEDIVRKLERDETELKRNIQLLNDKDAELTKSLTALEQNDQIDVDEAVTTTAPLYKQLINAYAEEAAIEDAIYYIGEALRKGVIDLEVFLKQVRQLSRKQFMNRALMQKCRQKAGLAG
ncbi:CLUMA_CG009455, isoform A [Clunio marinus]|uniref:CLUMA_CG009455, isoform A n=1 Tax=Clunio marinus TaxID=568069 RepID=A0A1J1I6S8_9DIPT|nr:CLUMA_CG009455, isoform A [Clunio marinus]